MNLSFGENRRFLKQKNWKKNLFVENFHICAEISAHQKNLEIGKLRSKTTARIIFLAWFHQNSIILRKVWTKFWENNFSPLVQNKVQALVQAKKAKKLPFCEGPLYAAYPS